MLINYVDSLGWAARETKSQLKRVLPHILSLFLALSLVSIILLFSIKTVALNTTPYIETLETASLSPHDRETLENSFSAVMGYLFQDATPLPGFSEREVLHLRDVKHLFRILDAVLLFSVGGFVVCGSILVVQKKYAGLVRGCLWGSTGLFGAMITLALTSFFEFEVLFVWFHEIAFSNDFWLLPPTSTLIRLFPQELFYDLSLRIIGLSTLLSLLILGGCLFVRAQYKNHNKSY